MHNILNIHIMYNSYSQRVGAKGSGADDFTMQSKPTGVFLHPKNNECSPQRPLLSGAASKRVNCGNGLAREKSETMLNQPFRASEITPSASLRAMNRPSRP